jgi:hypothetical protein
MDDGFLHSDQNSHETLTFLRLPTAIGVHILYDDM